MTTKQYLIDQEVSLDGSDYSHRFICAQIVSESAAQAGVEMNQSAVELTFNDDGLLIRAISIGKRYDRSEYFKKQVALGKQVFVDYPLNQPYEFLPNVHGLNHLGGEWPENFVIPKSSSANTFQYIGMLNHKDPAFAAFVDFDMHLTAPIFTNFEEGVWLDYANPLAPQLMNSEAVVDEYSDYDFQVDSEIVFNKMNFSTQAWPATYHHGRSGVAKWMQGPDIPVCPKTGETMKLICQLCGGIEDRFDSDFTSIIPNTLRHNITFKEGEDCSEYISKMDFWGMGFLYTFYCPTSKIAKIFIQST